MNIAHVDLDKGSVHYRGKAYASHKSLIGWYGCAPPCGLHGPFRTQAQAEEWVRRQYAQQEERTK